MSNSKPIHNHDSHGLGPARDGYSARPGNIARTGGPKKVHSIAVHTGMHKRTKNGDYALGGNHASAMDALTGATVVPGAIKSTPGYGNAGVRSGGPIIANPHDGAKRLTPIRAAFGMKHPQNLEELGRAVLAEATKN